MEDTVGPETTHENVLSNEDKFAKYHRLRGHTVKSEWPELVGDCVERATAIVRFGSPYYVTTQLYKEGLRAPRADDTNLYDPLRVIFFLDSQGYIAVTPRRG